MVEEREVITLLLGVVAVFYVFLQREKLESLPESHLLITGFLMLFAGWVSGVLESFVATDVLNQLQHGCYSVSSVILAVWCWKTCIRADQRPQ